MMDFFHPYVVPFILSLIIFAICFLLLLLLFRNKPVEIKNGLIFLFLIAYGFNCLGLTIGIFVGNSREPAVSTCISASLTLLGLVVVYIFTKDKNPTINMSLNINNALLVSLITLIIFPTTMLYGAYVGSSNRIQVETIELSNKTTIDLETKRYDYLLKATDDSIKTFLEIYKDSVIKDRNK